VLALAAGLLALAAVLAPIGARRASRVGTRRLVLAGALFVAGWIHLLLVPEHLAESPLLGVGFLAAAAAQIALAAVVAWRPSDTAAYVVVAVNVALVAVYGWAVVVGLPLGGGHADVAGIRIGAGEPVDLAGAATKLAEIVALVLAMRRLDPAEAVPPVTGRR
jgi:hypothetical protein